MVVLRRKCSNTLVPSLVEGYPVLVEAVRVFQEALKINTTTTVLLKEKYDIWSATCGTAFLNNATNSISCHVYVHRHSTLLGTLILIAHEMVHAWQIDTNRPDKSTWEQEAEVISLNLVTEIHMKRFPEKPKSMLRSEVIMARGWVH